MNEKFILNPTDYTQEEWYEMYKTAVEAYQNLHSRIDKAIEYINKHIRIDDEYPAYMEMLIEERDELLKILKEDK